MKVMKKMTMRSVRVELVLVFLPLILLSIFTCAIAVPEVLCKEAEREALLDFKLSFTADPYGELLSWSTHNPDCCTQWEGVECDVTGHVVSLLVGIELQSHQLRLSLLVLQHLTNLDLSNNNFTMRIPEFITSLANLESLELSYSGFYGKIPSSLGNLTHLQTLSLGDSNGLLHSDNLQWLPSLSNFTCSYCSFPLLPQPVSSVCPHNHSISLQSLDLSYSQISFNDFCCLINGTDRLTHLTLTSMKLNSDDFFRLLFQSPASSMLFPVLKSLDISQNQLREFMLAENSLGMQKLETLDISFNLITKFPDLSKFSSITYLDASFNKIQNFNSTLQPLPTSLTSLYISSNSLNSVISDSDFSKLPNLLSLDFSYNHLLTFKFSQTWVPPFNLTDLSLRSCNVGPHFPNWALTQKHLQSFDVSNSSIFGVIPNSFWNGITNLLYLNVSHNKLEGTIPNLPVTFPDIAQIDLSFNGLCGTIPNFLLSGGYLDAYNNKFSSFSASHNKVPKNDLWGINLSNNLLSGPLPGWVFGLNGLHILNLANNMLTGEIPSNVASSWKLTALHLNNNKFSGELPSSLKNCTQLIVLELGNNNFSGSVPFWVGDNLQQLVVLNLRSNNLSGEFSSKLCNLQRLQVLDLSGNRLSGSIPGCVDNFTSMTMHESFNVTSTGVVYPCKFSTVGDYVQFDYASIMWKGMLVNESVLMLLQVKTIDLSNNYLTGRIPSGFTTLKYLMSLDLSNNNLNGSIPDNIGHMKYLEVLELSSNRLGGEIPNSLAELTFLSALNLSSNNLRGEIPKSTQLQTFDPSSYGGNPKLCGYPLPTSCPWEKGTVKPSPSVRDHAEEEEGHERFDSEAFHAALGAGFASGLLGILVILNFHDPSRHAFFHMVSEVGDWIFVWTLLSKSRIKRRLYISKEMEATKR